MRTDKLLTIAVILLTACGQEATQPVPPADLGALHSDLAEPAPPDLAPLPRLRPLLAKDGTPIPGYLFDRELGVPCELYQRGPGELKDPLNPRLEGRCLPPVGAILHWDKPQLGACDGPLLLIEHEHELARGARLAGRGVALPREGEFYGLVAEGPPVLIGAAICRTPYGVCTCKNESIDAAYIVRAARRVEVEDFARLDGQ